MSFGIRVALGSSLLLVSALPASAQLFVAPRKDIPAVGVFSMKARETPNPLLCSPATQAVKRDSTITVTASGGTGQYIWKTPDSTTVPAGQKTINVPAASEGTFQFTVADGAQQSSCMVVVSAAGAAAEAAALTAPPPSTASSGTTSSAGASGANFLTQAQVSAGNTNPQVGVQLAELFLSDAWRFHLRSTLPLTSSAGTTASTTSSSQAPTSTSTTLPTPSDRLKSAILDEYGGLLNIQVGWYKKLNVLPVYSAEVPHIVLKDSSTRLQGDPARGYKNYEFPALIKNAEYSCTPAFYLTNPQADAVGIPNEIAASGTAPTGTAGTLASVIGLVKGQPVQITLKTGTFAGKYYRKISDVSGTSVTWTPELPAAPSPADTVTGDLPYNARPCDEADAEHGVFWDFRFGTKLVETPSGVGTVTQTATTPNKTTSDSTNSTSPSPAAAVPTTFDVSPFLTASAAVKFVLDLWDEQPRPGQTAGELQHIAGGFIVAPSIVFSYAGDGAFATLFNSQLKRSIVNANIDMGISLKDSGAIIGFTGTYWTNDKANLGKRFVVSLTIAHTASRDQSATSTASQSKSPSGS